MILLKTLFQRNRGSYGKMLAGEDRRARVPGYSQFTQTALLEECKSILNAGAVHGFPPLPDVASPYCQSRLAATGRDHEDTLLRHRLPSLRSICAYGQACHFHVACCARGIGGMFMWAMWETSA
jgi:hypothetical protein